MRQKIALYILLIVIQTSLLFGQGIDTTWIPFRANLIEQHDTIRSGFDFYLQSNTQKNIPSFNSKFKLFEFFNVDSIMDLHLLYKKRHYVLRRIEVVRLMGNNVWDITCDTLSNDSCYSIAVKSAGCMSNVRIGGLWLSNRNCFDIWVKDLMGSATFVNEYKKLKNGQFTIADSLIKINRKNSKAYIMRADAYVKLYDYKSAIRDYSKALRLEKNNAILLYKRGMCKEDLMDSKGAIKDFRRALELNPDYALAYCGRAFASSSFARENNLEEMKLVLEDYDKAILLDPNLTNAYIYRGYFKLRLDDKNGACADFSKARELGGRVYDDICK